MSRPVHRYGLAAAGFRAGGGGGRADFGPHVPPIQRLWNRVLRLEQDYNVAHERYRYANRPPRAAAVRAPISPGRVAANRRRAHNNFMRRRGSTRFRMDFCQPCAPRRRRVVRAARHSWLPPFERVRRFPYSSSSSSSSNISHRGMDLETPEEISARFSTPSMVGGGGGGGGSRRNPREQSLASTQPLANDHVGPVSIKNEDPHDAGGISHRERSRESSPARDDFLADLQENNPDVSIEFSK